LGKTVSVLNMKGGVGKTTLAVNIASALAILNHKKVLMVDLDPQYNATQYLVNLQHHPEYVSGKEPTVFDIMIEGRELSKSILNGSNVPKRPKITIDKVARALYNSKSGKLDLIPSTIHLINLEMAPRGIEHKLQNFIKRIKSAYDFIIIDCPPTFSVFLLSGFLASEYYLVPVKPDPLSTLGIPLLEKVLAVHSETYSKEIEPLGVVFTMVRNTNEMKSVMDGIKDTSAGKRYVFKNSLSMSTYIAEASRENKALFEYPKSKRYGREIIKITEEFLSLFS